jgi:cation diffusion facilitator CzcD-associated flavoprotein CzcO
MLTDDWYPTLTKDNVELITEPIAEIRPREIVTADHEERPADVLVLATGLKTHGFIAPMEIIGTGGRTLAEEWSPVARAYLGLSVPGFPNMFLLYGPNTNGGTGSVIFTIEAGMRHVIAALNFARAPCPESRSSARRPKRSTASCARPSARPSGTRDAQTGTSTRTGMTPTSGRGYGAPTAAAPPGLPRVPTS